ncbi:hypothetical protein ANN_13249 [Periplaneta americana]|uniref:HTH psq-type domain-containing protein n=1 Tax=Periplaneta americana TaxID=6978 RepID=A0ABQ8TLF1_PERAM|nr:hypothetical protein ANN_13249 [Periplaneta americana]
MSRSSLCLLRTVLHRVTVAVPCVYFQVCKSIGLAQVSFPSSCRIEEGNLIEFRDGTLRSSTAIFQDLLRLPLSDTEFYNVSELRISSGYNYQGRHVRLDLVVGCDLKTCDFVAVSGCDYSSKITTPINLNLQPICDSWRWRLKYVYVTAPDNSQRLQRVHNACVRFICNIRKYDHITPSLKTLQRRAGPEMDPCTWAHCEPYRLYAIIVQVRQMPRTHIGPKPKAVLKKWDTNDMIKAITSVREKKMGLRKAVKLYNVPQTTLQRFINNNMSPEECVKLKIERKTVLPAELEKQLVGFLVEMDNRFYGLTRTDVKRMAYQLAQRNNIPHPFGSNVTAAINKFFDMLEAEYDKHSYPADRVYNVDETGLTVVQSKIPHVIGLKEDPLLSSDESRSTVHNSVIEMNSATARTSQATSAVVITPSTSNVNQPRTDPHQPSKVGLREDGCSKSVNSDSQKACVSPKDIMPVPQLKKKTSNRGRKPGSSAVITSSPYKAKLEQSLFKAKERISVKPKLTKNKPNKGNKINKSKSCKRRLMLDQESDEESTPSNISSGKSEMDLPVGETAPTEEDATCIFCGNAFSTDVRGDLWIQCLVCEMWSH